MKDVKHKRVRLVILTKLQWAIASRTLLHAAMFLFAAGMLGLIGQYVSDPYAGFRANLAACWENSAPTLLALFCMLPIFVRDMLRFSNRVAGPIYRLTMTMQRHADGEENVPDLKFRDGDLCDEVPDTFNRMIRRLKQSTPSDTDADRVLADVRELVEV
ncbi:MAG: hypothetical protein R3C19_19310 [Planctomycetaceae bacterium]